MKSYKVWALWLKTKFYDLEIGTINNKNAFLPFWAPKRVYGRVCHRYIGKVTKGKRKKGKRQGGQICTHLRGIGLRSKINHYKVRTQCANCIIRVKVFEI